MISVALANGRFDEPERHYLAVAAENYGIRALWASNYWNHWDGFVSLVQAALATEKIELGVSVQTPLELSEVTVRKALLALVDKFEGLCFVFRDYGVLATTEYLASFMSGSTIPGDVRLR